MWKITHTLGLVNSDGYHIIDEARDARMNPQQPRWHRGCNILRMAVKNRTIYLWRSRWNDLLSHRVSAVNAIEVFVRIAMHLT